MALLVSSRFLRLSLCTFCSLILPIWCTDGDKVYWTNFKEGSVQRADAQTGGNVETIIASLTEPSGIVVDVATCSLYVSCKDGIRKVGIHGQSSNLWHEWHEDNDNNPLWFDLQSRKLYWYSRQSNEIRRASVDDEDQDVESIWTFMGVNLVGFTGTVAESSVMLYFADDEENTITYWTSEDEEYYFVDDFSQGYEYFSLSIDTVGHMMYFSDAHHGICRLPLGYEDGDDLLQVLFTTSRYPQGLMYHGGAIYWMEYDNSKSLRQSKLRKSTVTDLNPTIDWEIELSPSEAGFPAIDFLDGALAWQNACYTSTTTTTTSTSTATITSTSSATTSTSMTTTTTTPTTTQTTTSKTTTVTTTATHTTATDTTTTTASMTTTTTWTTTATETTTTKTTTTKTTTTTRTPTTTTTTKTSTTRTTTTTKTTTTETETETTTTKTTTTVTTTSTTTTTPTITTTTITTTSISITTTTRTKTSTTTATFTTSTSSTLTETATTTTSTTLTFTGWIPIINVWGTVKFPASGVRANIVRESVVNAFASEFSLEKESISATVIISGVKKPNRMRRLEANVWTVKYEVEALPELATKLIKALKLHALGNETLLKELKRQLIVGGAELDKDFYLKFIAGPYFTKRDRVDGQGCGEHFCAKNFLIDPEAPKYLCEFALSCEETQRLCCHKNVGIDDDDDPSTASAVVFSIAAGLLPFMFCCTVGICRKLSQGHHSDVMKRRTQTLSRRTTGNTPHSESLKDAAGVGDVYDCGHDNFGGLEFADTHGLEIGQYYLDISLKIQDAPVENANQIQELPAGSLVVVEEIYQSGPYEAIYGRIRDPEPGWIPLKDIQTFETFVNKEPRTATEKANGIPTAVVNSKQKEKGKDAHLHSLLPSFCGEWRVQESGRLTGRHIAVEAGGGTFEGSVATPSQDFYVEEGRIVNSIGSVLNLTITDNDTMLWAKAGDHTTIWKRIRPAHKYVAGDAVELTISDGETPLSSAGRVISSSQKSVRVQFQRTVKEVAPSALVLAEDQRCLRKVQSLIASLKGEWRMYDERNNLLPGLISVGVTGRAVYDEAHWPEQDLIALSSNIARGDGWTISMHTSNLQELRWSMPGKPSIIWRRLHSIREYSLGDAVKSLGLPEAPAGLEGQVVGVAEGKVRVNFSNGQSLDVPAVDIIPQSGLPNLTSMLAGEAPLSIKIDQGEIHSDSTPLKQDDNSGVLSYQNADGRRPPPLEVDAEQIPPKGAPASTTPWSQNAPASSTPPNANRGSAASPGSGGNVSVFPPTPQPPMHSPPVNSPAPPSGGNVPAEMMMVFPPGAEHPVLYQQVVTPVHTPTSPPSTVSPPGSPNIIQTDVNARGSSSRPAALSTSSGPSSPSEGTHAGRSAPGSPNQDVLPGFNEVHPADSGRKGWWGSNLMQAVTGPLGSGMSGVSNAFRTKGQRSASPERSGQVTPISEHFAEGESSVSASVGAGGSPKGECRPRRQILV